LRKEARGEQALRRASRDVAVGETQQRLAGEDREQGPEHELEVVAGVEQDAGSELAAEPGKREHGAGLEQHHEGGERQRPAIGLPRSRSGA
jgi:hypothetical protein